MSENAAAGPPPVGLSRRGFLRSLPASAAGIGWVAAALASFAPRATAGVPESRALELRAPLEPPPFVLKPNPPSAGKDLEVVYTGDSPESVVYQVGSGGDFHKPVIGADGRFTIPKRWLKGGLRLVILDESIGVDGALSVLIEPD